MQLLIDAGVQLEAINGMGETALQAWHLRDHNALQMYCAEALLPVLSAASTKLVQKKK